MFDPNLPFEDLLIMSPWSLALGLLTLTGLIISLLSGDKKLILIGSVMFAAFINTRFIHVGFYSSSSYILDLINDLLVASILIASYRKSKLVGSLVALYGVMALYAYYPYATDSIEELTYLERTNQIAYLQVLILLTGGINGLYNRFFKSRELRPYYQNRGVFGRHNITPPRTSITGSGASDDIFRGKRFDERDHSSTNKKPTVKIIKNGEMVERAIDTTPYRSSV